MTYIKLSFQKQQISPPEKLIRPTNYSQPVAALAFEAST